MATPQAIDVAAELQRRYGGAPVPVSRAGIDEFSYAQIRAALRLGLLTRIRRGVLAPAAADPAETYLLVARSAEEDEAAAQALARRARALLRPLPPETRISHESAAILRRLWLPCLPDGDLHVTIPGQSERRDGGIHIHGTSAAAEVEYAVRVEGAMTVDDVLDRRTRVGLVDADRERCRGAVETLVARTVADLV